MSLSKRINRRGFEEFYPPSKFKISSLKRRNVARMNEPDSLLLERGNGRYVRKDLRFEDGTATATLRAIHPSKPFFQSLSVRIFKKQGLGEETKTHSRIRIDFSDDLHRNTIRITIDCKELKYNHSFIRSS